MTKLSKSDRMELRRDIGYRNVAKPAPVPVFHGPECLWPHACFHCRKSWKLSDNSTAKCPECSGDLHWMGRAFKVPRKADGDQWKKVEALWAAGFRFINHTRWRETAVFPEHLCDVEEFIRENQDHPFRVGAKT